MNLDRSHPPRLPELSEAELIALLHSDFSLFVQIMHAATMSGEPLIWHDYLDLICSRLQDVAHARRQNLIITMPPRNLKSFCVSVCLPAFVLGHYPGQEVMCISYGYPLANEFAAGSLRIMQHPLYRMAFGADSDDAAQCSEMIPPTFPE